jgi:SAM-dependent methyltransferase
MVVSAVPPGARTALDVGTGDGLLAAPLRATIPDVTGIDSDAEVIDRARDSAAEVNWLVGDGVGLGSPVSGAIESHVCNSSPVWIEPVDNFILPAGTDTRDGPKALPKYGTYASHTGYQA